MRKKLISPSNSLYVKEKIKYIRKIIFTDKRKIISYTSTILFMIGIATTSNITTDRFMQESTKKMGELTVINASETINSVFSTGENVLNLVSDSIRSNNSFIGDPLYIQTYLQLVYSDLTSKSDESISSIYCFYNGEFYLAGKRDTNFDINKNMAYQQNDVDIGEIFYIPPHKEDVGTRQVITIAKKFGTKNADMIAVDIKVDKLQEYLAKYSKEKLGSGSLMGKDFEILVKGDKKNDSSTLNPLEETLEHGPYTTVGTDTKMYTIKDKNTTYFLVVKKVGKDWFISYKIAASILYKAQYRVLNQIILMTVLLVVLIIIISITIYRKELSRILDPVTGLLNKVGIIQMLTYYLKNKSQKNIAVIYLDIDDFKKVNDTYGHSAGDKVILKMGKMLYKVKHSLFGRIGGDEFAGVLYADKSKEQIIEQMEEFLKEIAKPIEVEGHIIEMSCSIGIIFCSTKQSVDAYTLLNQSDENMYIAKRTGKNKIYWS